MIHSDLCGPFKNTSLGGSKYFLTFTNDFSKKTWVYFFRLEVERVEKFKAFKKLIENVT